ncbi:MAG TPA: rhodanese-like domain-containing protein, partial [Thermoanaerobaculia bacterium]|nr:rhodanese-like domain-containing protein [Thermoanaerobaculia bacterium]
RGDMAGEHEGRAEVPSPPLGGEERVREKEGGSEITPRELQAWLDSGRQVRLLDVRTPVEHRICRIEGAELIPLQELPRRVGEVPGTEGDEVIVPFCHHGHRSARATAFLRDRGYRAVNLAGGIDRWSAEVDPSVPRY